MNDLATDDGIVFAFGLLVLVAVVVLLRAAAGLDRQWQRRRVHCPERGRSAECVVEQDARTGRWVDVMDCSLLPKGEPLACEKTCLKLMEHAVTAPGSGPTGRAGSTGIAHRT